MEQLNFDVPIVRKRDPDSSQAGANYQKQSGSLVGDRGLIVKTLFYHKNSTGAELARVIATKDKDSKKRTYDRLVPMARKRLCDLVKHGDAREVCQRKCTSEGSLSTAYELTAAGIRLVRG